MKASNREGHRLLDHVTDALIEAWGRTFEEALAQSALALTEVMVDVRSVVSRLDVEIEANGHDELELLYNWLEELILRFEIDGMVFKEFRIELIPQNDDLLGLRAHAGGELFDPNRHRGRVGIKGVTYHMMSVDQAREKVTTRFLLDL